MLYGCARIRMNSPCTTISNARAGSHFLEYDRFRKERLFKTLKPSIPRKGKKPSLLVSRWSHYLARAPVASREFMERIEDPPPAERRPKRRRRHRAKLEG